jgi:hypothetical protein
VVASIPLLLADSRPNLTGAWVQGSGGPPFNEAGAALQALWDPADDPQVACEDPGHLTETWEMPWKKLYMAGYAFIAVECHKPL